MDRDQRQSYILKLLKEKQRVYISELSDALKVSDDTLRRDLSYLDDEGLLTKVHGGAVAKSPIPIDFSHRLNCDIDQKQGLAAKVIPLFAENDVILVDGGTSNLQVIKQLPDIALTIYTNSFPIVQELLSKPKVEVVFLGGELLRDSQVTVGLTVYRALQFLRPDWLLLGICSVHPQIGLTVPSREESYVKQLMIERSAKTIVIADNHKLNTAHQFVISALNDINYLVVEDNRKEEIEKNWKNRSYSLL